jgi:formylglycine-generating enzyme
MPVPFRPSFLNPLEGTVVRLLACSVIGFVFAGCCSRMAGPSPEQPAASQQQVAQRSGLPVVVTNSLGMKLVLIPAGEFMMGSPDDEEGRRSDEGPQHRVKITESFYLGVYEVTQEQYERVMGVNPSWYRTFVDEERKDFVVRTVPLYPVEQVAWDDALAFCDRLSALPDEQAAGHRYYLPTEAEWEYACRAGATTPFIFGETLSSDKDANFNGSLPCGSGVKGPYRELVSVVGSYRPNAWGLHDMHGNVAEWCSDWYTENYYTSSPVDDPKGPATGFGRVHRGGSCDSSALTCRSACRDYFRPDYRIHFLGFRIALDVTQKAEPPKEGK